MLVEGTVVRFTRPLAAYLTARQSAGEVRDNRCDGAAAMCVDLILAEITLSICTDVPMSDSRVDACVERIFRFRAARGRRRLSDPKRVPLNHTNRVITNPKSYVRV